MASLSDVVTELESISEKLGISGSYYNLGEIHDLVEKIVDKLDEHSPLDDAPMHSLDDVHGVLCEVQSSLDEVKERLEPLGELDHKLDTLIDIGREIVDAITNLRP